MNPRLPECEKGHRDDSLGVFEYQDISPIHH